jgi:hypothetical protein
MGEVFHQHERGEISDEAFAEKLCHEMALPLSYEQFSTSSNSGNKKPGAFAAGFFILSLYGVNQAVSFTG